MITSLSLSLGRTVVHGWPTAELSGNRNGLQKVWYTVSSSDNNCLVLKPSGSGQPM